MLLLAVKVVKTTQPLLTTISQYITTHWLYLLIGITICVAIPFLFSFGNLFLGYQQRQEQAVVALIRAEEMIKRGNCKAAITHLTQAISQGKNPQIQARAYDNRGTAYRMEKQIDLAITDHTTALSLVDQHSSQPLSEFDDDSQTAKNQRKSVFYYHRGLAYDAKAATLDGEHKQPYMDLAIADYRFATALDSSLSFAPNTIASRELRTRLGLPIPSTSSGTTGVRTKTHDENEEDEGIPSPRLSPTKKKTTTKQSKTETTTDTSARSTSTSNAETESSAKPKEESTSASKNKKKAKRAE